MASDDRHIVPWYRSQGMYRNNLGLQYWTLLSLLVVAALVPGRANSQDVTTACGAPAVPLNARVSVSGLTATYSCDPGYELFGVSQLTCSNGKWTGDLPFCGTNVALHKPANQSSTVRGGNAGLANDGTTGTGHGADGEPAGGCSETQRETAPWWRTDLLRHYPVRAVRIATRGCCGHQPIQDLEIRVGNSSSDFQRNPLCAWFPGTIDEGTTKTFLCAKPLIGQFVLLQLVGVEGSLSLCEVEVFTTDEFSSERCASSQTSEEAQLAAFSRSCYEFGVRKGGSFAQAREQCQAGHPGGDLVHGITSSAVSTFLTQELERRRSSLTTQLVWIGAQKDPGLTARTWRWVNGEMVGKPMWGKDQPNNYNGEQNCAVFDGGRGWLWNDVGCNLDYLHWICQHMPSTCGSPDKQLNTTIVGSNYTVGAIIEYKCPVGHMSVGDVNRTCGKDGFWMGTAPSCKYVNCGNPTAPEHGTVRLIDSRTTHGAKAEYKCQENYTISDGNSVRTCGDDGKWDGDMPQCLFDWCPEPPSVTGGIVSVTGKRAGSTANYECQSGFILFGQSILTCGLGGEWSGKAPTCKYIDCGAPPNIDNGQYELINGTTTYGSIVSYTCPADYWLNGNERQTCTREGKWSSGAPSCELITCPEPDVPSGSYVVGYDFNVHSTIEWHCEIGHILRGTSLHTCLQDGTWSAATPACDFIDCGKVQQVPYGTMEYTNGTTYLGSEIKYSCSPSYRLNGVQKRYCLESALWSDSTPKCEEIRCPEPILATHSIVSVTGNDRMYGRTLIRTSESSHSASNYKIGALLKYRCERGYKIIGEPLSTCEDTGSWSGDVPQCVYVDCKNPERLLHGKYTLTSNATYYGAIVLYECDPNYELDGVSRRLCIENGTWSSETPVCKEIQCKQPDTIDGATVQVSTFSIGGIAHYNCPRGHLMEGNSTRVCLKKGIWSGRAPVCQVVDCNHPGSIENGRVILPNGTTFNNPVEYHCVPQFQRIGPYLRKCMDDGQWSGEEPKCELVTEEAQDSQNLGMSIGIGCGIILFLLILLAIIYFRLRKPVPVKNTENIEGAERKEDQNAAVMSYATLNDRNRYGNSMASNIYDHINEDNMYDAPYEETGRDSGTYEPEPIGRTNGSMVTINGVSVR